MYTEYHPKSGADIWMLSLDAERAPQPFLRTPFNEYGPMVSPDGRWLAYTSDESGRDEIYVVSFPRSGGKWQISTEGGTEPVWAPGGNEVFYRNGNSLMRVVLGADPLSVAPPELLFEGRYARGGLSGLPNYDVRRDGLQLLMIEEGEERPAPTQLVVTMEWPFELARRLAPRSPA